MTKILGLGHPRTGTGYTTKVLQQMGLDIGHERYGKDGIVAWQYAIGKPYEILHHKLRDKDEPEYDFLLYNVRDPKKSLASIVYTVGRHAWGVIDRVLDLPDDISRTERAIISITTFDKLILKRKPDLIWRIEDSPSLIQKELGIDKQIEYNTEVYNARPHKSLETLQRPRDSYIEMINEFCVKYNYDKMFV